MTAGIDTRDEWMRRTGPFYSLLVAGQTQTRLPLAASLVPSQDDVTRSRAWLPIAGMVVGVALAALAALLLRTALVPVVVASLVVALGVFATGGWFETGLGQATAVLFRSRDSEPAGASVTVSATLVVFVLVKVAALLGTSPAAWTGALVVSQVAGRYAILLAIRLPGFSWGRRAAADAAAEQPLATPSWRAVGIASVISIVGCIALGGGAGAVALVPCALFAWIAARHVGDDGKPPRDRLAASGAVVELLALLCFAAWSPALS